MKQRRCPFKSPDGDPGEALEQPSFTIENEGYQLIWRECEDGDGGTIYWFERVPE